MPPPPLLAGPYHQPRLRVGRRVTCPFRDRECVVTSWSDAPLPWPQVQARGQRGGSGLLMTDELLRAVRTESAEAVRHWWGVSEGTVWRWRRWAGVTQWGTPGSQQLHTRTSRRGADTIRAKEWAAGELARKSAAAKAAGVKPDRWAGRRWTAEMDALLGADYDEAVAARLGKSPTAVRGRRLRLGIPLFRHRQKWYYTLTDRAAP